MNEWFVCENKKNGFTFMRNHCEILSFFSFDSSIKEG